MAWVEQFETTIPNDTAAAIEVQERIVSRLEELGYPPRDVFGCRLALEEALVNAIKHGNDNDPSKSVRVKCCIGAESFAIEIEDEGPGFEPQDVPDPTAEENLEKPSGRGIMLMRAFMTRVDYQGRGNRVLLEKARGNGDDE
ncbi:MAG: ATP-binding protein [Planctomycetota bacterium]|nr:ATP-binding protein [Planctomycetaceae bacterium]MDQ3330464.1 ATP-binding protein [Planctomycetota bacterium]